MDIIGGGTIDEEFWVVEDVLYSLDPWRSVLQHHCKHTGLSEQAKQTNYNLVNRFRKPTTQALETVRRSFQVEDGIAVFLIETVALVNDSSNFCTALGRCLLPGGRGIFLDMQSVALGMFDRISGFVDLLRRFRT